MMLPRNTLHQQKSWDLATEEDQEFEDDPVLCMRTSYELEGDRLDPENVPESRLFLHTQSRDSGTEFNPVSCCMDRIEDVAHSRIASWSS